MACFKHIGSGSFWVEPPGGAPEGATAFNTPTLRYSIIDPRLTAPLNQFIIYESQDGSADSLPTIAHTVLEAFVLDMSWFTPDVFSRNAGENSLSPAAIDSFFAAIADCIAPLVGPSADDLVAHVRLFHDPSAAPLTAASFLPCERYARPPPDIGTPGLTVEVIKESLTALGTAFNASDAKPALYGLLHEAATAQFNTLFDITFGDLFDVPKGPSGTRRGGFAGWHAVFLSRGKGSRACRAPRVIGGAEPLERLFAPLFKATDIESVDYPDASEALAALRASIDTLLPPQPYLRVPITLTGVLDEIKFYALLAGSGRQDALERRLAQAVRRDHRYPNISSLIEDLPGQQAADLIVSLARAMPGPMGADPNGRFTFNSLPLLEKSLSPYEDLLASTPPAERAGAFLIAHEADREAHTNAAARKAADAALISSGAADEDPRSPSPSKTRARALTSAECDNASKAFATPTAVRLMESVGTDPQPVVALWALALLGCPAVSALALRDPGTLSELPTKASLIMTVARNRAFQAETLMLLLALAPFLSTDVPDVGPLLDPSILAIDMPRWPPTALTNKFVADLYASRLDPTEIYIIFCCAYAVGACLPVDVGAGTFGTAVDPVGLLKTYGSVLLTVLGFNVNDPVNGIAPIIECCSSLLADDPASHSPASRSLGTCRHLDAIWATMFRCISQQMSTKAYDPGSDPHTPNAACDAHRALRIAENHSGLAIMDTLSPAQAAGKALAKARSPSAPRTAAPPAPPNPAAPRQPRLATNASTATPRTAKPRPADGRSMAQLKPGVIVPKGSLVAGFYASQFADDGVSLTFRGRQFNKPALVALLDSLGFPAGTYLFAPLLVMRKNPTMANLLEAVTANAADPGAADVILPCSDWFSSARIKPCFIEGNAPRSSALEAFLG